VRTKNVFIHAPSAGQCGAQVVDHFGVSHHPLPTKTSRLLIQSAGKSRCFWRACLHVLMAIVVWGLSLLIIVAMIRSHVSRSFIFLSHLAFISSFEWMFSCIVLSHLRTQIRCADSDISICSSRVFPFFEARVR
jgi:hypothetical protein